MKISVVSPSNREHGLKVVQESLDKQVFRDFEWLTDTSSDKNQGDFYALNKAWNRLFNKAQGELIVSIVDNTEFAEDTLQKLWDHYIENPVRCYSGIGTQYDGDKITWTDLRIEQDMVYPISPIDMEFRLASVPKRAIQAVGGIDEEYDKVAGCSEKELCLRIGALGYKFYIDKSIHYKFYKHEDHGEQWHEKYKKALELLGFHTGELIAGRRLRLNYVAR